MNLIPQMVEISVDNQRANYNTVDHKGTPLKIRISIIVLRHVLSWSKLDLERKFHEAGTFDVLRKLWTTTPTRFLSNMYIVLAAVLQRACCCKGTNSLHWTIWGYPSFCFIKEELNMFQTGKCIVLY